MLPPLFTAPTANDIKIAQDFVRTEWAAYAAFGWSQYQEKGRGLVIDNQHSDRPLRYITDPEEIPVLQGQGISLPSLVESYDPERSVVVMITKPYTSIEEGYRAATREVAFEDLAADVEAMERGLAAALAEREGKAPPPPTKQQPPIATAAIYTFDPPPAEAGA